MKKVLLGTILGCTGIILASAPASATLTSLYNNTDTLGLSSGGCGTIGANANLSSCSIGVTIPSGSTVLAAYLYTSTNDAQFTPVGSGDYDTTTLNGTAFKFTGLTINDGNAQILQAGRADVTSLVSGVVGSGGSTYNFTVNEAATLNQDGEALFIVYKNPALPLATVGIIDGAADVLLGDSATLNFGGLGYKAGGTAQLRVADGFSNDSPIGPAGAEVSTIKIGSTVLSNSVGNCDDSVDNACLTGNLITVGGDNDPVNAPDSSSATQTTINNTHEVFDFSSALSNTQTSASLTTANGSQDDNIFALAYIVGVIPQATGPGGKVPEPLTLSLFGAGLAGAVAMGRRRKKA